MNLQTGINSILNNAPERGSDEQDDEGSFNEYKKEMGDDWLEKSIKQSAADWKQIASQVKVKRKQEFSNLTKPDEDFSNQTKPKE